MRELTIEDGFKSLFITCCILQVIIPFLALAIKERIKSHGIKMKENPYFSVFNISPFWREARELNEELNDEKVKLLLQIRDSWLFIAFVSFFVVVAF